MSLPRIVIVGGGAGGLELATRLGHSLGRAGQARIILVDACLTHIWKPLLHEVAAGTINSYEDELNYFAHAAQHRFEFQLGRFESLDREAKTITLAPLADSHGNALANARHLRYDWLVMAIGSTSNDFGTEGAREHCIFLDSRAQADRFQSQFLNMYLSAHAYGERQDNPPELNIAIVGAGATGVELAAELHHAAHQFAEYGLDDICPSRVNISLIEAADRILPLLPEGTSAAARQKLEGLGIKVFTRQKVTKISHDGLQASSGLFVPASLKVWSAGIKAPDFMKDLAGLETSHINQLVTKPTLQSTRDAHIFAMGDCGSCTLPGSSRPVPPRAQTAHQQASYLLKALPRHLQAKSVADFRFRDKGSLVSLNSSAVGVLMGSIAVQGKLARLMYISLYRLHQVALHGFFKTAVLCCKDMLSRKSRPEVKLH
ncbi:MAG: NAD(P)/FAD-dependent oxidoreductase [Paraperlucidibaca sp.]